MEFDKYGKIGLPISKEEASAIVKSKSGIVSGGGYILLPDMYCAMGSVPSCFRGGDISSINSLVSEWYKLTLRGLVIEKGFYPDPYAIYSLITLQHELGDWSINIPEMVRFCVDSKYSSEELLNDGKFSNSRIWWEYFNKC